MVGLRGFIPKRPFEPDPVNTAEAAVIPDIYITHASLAYHNQFVFRDVFTSCSCLPHIAILGASGVGKSSLLAHDRRLAHT